MSKATINFNGSQLAGVQIGDNNTQGDITQRVNSQGIEVKATEFFDKLQSIAPPEAQPVFAEAQQLAQQYEASPEVASDPTYTAKVSSVWSQIQSYLPMLTAGAVAFGSGYFRTMVSTNPMIAPIIGGVVAALEAVQTQ